MSKDETTVTFTVEPLAKHHKRTDFSCGAEPLDLYLKNQASQDAKRGFAAPMVAVTIDTIVIAYYTLSAFKIDLPDLTEDERKKLPKYPDVPATLLGRLAVDEKYRGLGIGADMLAHALTRSYEQSSKIASYAIIVDAKDEAAISFYQHFGFTSFPDRRDRLYLPMKQVAKLF